VVIPTYNGRELLARNLPPLIRAIECYPGPVEIIVVDDAGSDDTIAFLREYFPHVTVLVNEVNAGFAVTANRGISAARYELVLSLNNDILVPEDFFERPAARFRDPQLFSVTPNIVDPRRDESQSVTRLKPGICWFLTSYLQPADLPTLEGDIPLFYGSGGASFYDREKLLLLGGFDPVYHPFYVEDMDLSYRAWKAGWKCLLEPSVLVRHETSSTILSLHRKRHVKFIGDRNRTLFLWLNVTDPFLIVRYFLALPFSFLADVAGFRKYKFIGFFRALAYLQRLPELRRQRKKLFRLSDRQVIAQIR
jgi:GT2 family glycosyltransferase